MITKSLYVCEICGTSYPDKKVCENCESSHIKAKKIKSQRFVAFNNGRLVYPVSIEVEMENGEIKTYKRY